MMEIGFLPRGENYAAWNLSNDRPTNTQELIPRVVGAAILAPSSHNTQPWQFSKEGERLIISPDLRRRLLISDPTDRQMYLSLGAAVANIKIASHYHGFEVNEQIIANADGSVSKSFAFDGGYIPSDDIAQLYGAIPRRVSNRTVHTQEVIPNSARQSLEGINSLDGIGAALIEDQERKNELALLVYRASTQILTNPYFTNELANWIRSNFTREFDGMPGFGFGLDDIDSLIFNRIVVSGGMVPEGPRRDLELLTKKTASIGIISTNEDNPEAWYRAGEAYQNLALKAANLGLSTNILAALVETARYPEDLQRLIQTDQRPQIMFRMGFSSVPVEHSPRRPYYQVMAVGPEFNRISIDLGRPNFFNVSEKYPLSQLLEELGDVSLIDRYSKFLADKFTLDNPEKDMLSQSARDELKEYVKKHNNPDEGVWVYYPWRKALVHVPAKEDFLELLFSRNNPCISSEDQGKISQMKVGVVGLSVGSNIAQALAKMGVLNLSLADFDTVDLSNLSRMSIGTILDVGEDKTTLLARELYEFNPFIELLVKREGINPANLPEFMSGLDIFIDHMDNIPLKIEARKVARHLGKIVLMATDIDKKPLVEIELPEDEYLFNGRVPYDVIAELSKPSKSFAEWGKNAVQVFGLDNTSAPVLQNFINVLNSEQNYGSQLGLTGSVVAGILSYYVYEIARGNQEKLQKMRVVKIEQDDLVNEELDLQKREEFARIFKL